MKILTIGYSPCPARSTREFECLNHDGSGWAQVTLPLLTKERLVDFLETAIGDGWLRDAAKRVLHQMVPASLMYPDHIWSDGTARRFLKQYGIDWALYTTPNTQSFERGLPYVMPVFDLQHRLHRNSQRYRPMESGNVANISIGTERARRR